MLITRHCSLTRAPSSPRWVCSLALPGRKDTELWLNNTWRPSARFATLQLSSSNRVSQAEEFLSPLLIPHQLSPHLQPKFPEIRNPSRETTRQTELERQRGFSRHRGLNLPFCWTWKAAVLSSEKPPRPDTV